MRQPLRSLFPLMSGSSLLKTDLKTKTARVLLANSITLTPGTITVSLQDNVYTVHCLDKQFGEGLSDSTFVWLLHKIEGQVAK